MRAKGSFWLHKIGPWLEEVTLTRTFFQGSGKTTQIPQFLEQAGWCEEGKLVAVTQVGELMSLPNDSHICW